MFQQAVRYAAVALLLVGCSTANATPSAAPPGDVLRGPNAGHVLFGDSYDHTTFVISGPTTQAPQGRAISLVGHFARRVATGQIHLLVILGGKTILDRAIAVTNGPWSVYGVKIPGAQLSEPGPLLVRFEDDRSVLLSTGTLIVTPGSPGSPASSAPRPT